ncbi:sigma-54-dependent Fis family transcriptional regulator [Caballeronia cordobensis]|uniref:sigma-54-dependent Fis family transcriptional regulator n=1 Tax=Caballeronia cordobensis TaxID=1353886 RepID=UPI00045F0C7B|nr:Fis family GAF modulated sigma54 specific transcriptional regulator [Burkholderia sp. RPE67]
MSYEPLLSKGTSAIQALRASWERCAAGGLTENHQLCGAAVSRSEIESIKATSEKLLKYAQASVENTFEQISGFSSIVLLSNAQGTIVCGKGDSDFVSSEFGRLFTVGTNWAESTAGNNAVGTCLAVRAPVAVEMEQHYLTQLRSLSGSAAPIFDHAGEVVGVLAAYGSKGAAHTLPLIRTVAILIENRMLVAGMTNGIIVSFHPVAGNIATIKQGIVVFGPDGRLLGSNSAARSILNIERHDTSAKRFRDLFGSSLSWERFIDKANGRRGSQFTATLRDGREVTLAVSAAASSECASGESPALGKMSTADASTSIGRPNLRLNDLDLGDPQMQRAIQKASMILGSDIPLLIEGESGVGKEVFTAAFHSSGPRNGGPFVAVNCAAIPEGLIESELFGYEEGAFTGAKRKGFPGKILQADGGTLFLDEIGDMPLALQGRLLRVLQERRVTPLGSARNTPVDISIVCATHRSMASEVASGRFREDLFYRLNGLRVVLPSLRERKDIDKLIDALVASESHGRIIDIDLQARVALREYSWPGNIRQLQMVLRTALVILQGGNRLTLEHLPDELALPDSETASELEVAVTDQAVNCRLAEVERNAIRRAVAAAHGNVSQAARSLGISRKTLYRKLERLSEDTSNDRR